MNGTEVLEQKSRVDHLKQFQDVVKSVNLLHDKINKLQKVNTLLIHGIIVYFFIKTILCIF